MRKKIILLMVSLLLPVAASAYDVCIDGIYYDIVKKAKQATVTYGDNYEGTYSGDVVIPETVVYDGVTLDVIAIGDRAFYECKLNSLTIPSSIKKIEMPEYRYFAKSIDTLFISDLAAWCAIEFNNEWASPARFAKNFCLNKEVISELVIPDGVTAIGISAFYGVKTLTSVKLPDSVESIGSCAFAGCTGLRTVTWGKGITSVGERAFNDCENIERVNISDLKAWLSIDFGESYIELALGVGTIRSIQNPLFYAGHLYLNGSELTDVVVPDGIETLYTHTFEGFTAMTSLVIPNSVKKFEANGGRVGMEQPWSMGEFKGIIGCSNLKGVKIGTGLEKMEIAGCAALTSVEVDESHMKLIINNCPSLTENDIKIVKASAVYIINCDAITELTPANVTANISSFRVSACSGLKKLQVSDETSGVYVSDCPELTTIILGLGISDAVNMLQVSSCKELTDVYCPIITPLKDVTNAFSDDCQIEYATLHVPQESVKPYKATEPWSGFGTIVAAKEGEPAYTPLPPYALLSDDKTTLTFYYNKNDIPDDCMKVRPFSSEYSRGWNSNSKSITTVVFDESFADFTDLTSTAYWFHGCSNLTTIKGIKNLKTDNVTDMSHMFRGCASLTSLDVSGFKTDNVTDMSLMFLNCEGLTSLDVSGFNTANVTSMSYMFCGCSGLTSLDVSKFNTANVTRMDYMFDGCYGLTSLDVSKFNTANVTNMKNMFSGCGLTSLDLRSFNTANVTNMVYMFSDCGSLMTIYAGDGWNTDKVDISSWGTSYPMFQNCYNLIGGAGTKYSGDGYTYAHIDGGADNPGYFTSDVLEQKLQPYAALNYNNSTLTFYYDIYMNNRYGMSVGPFDSSTSRGWDSNSNSITTVVFDESFADCTDLTSTAYWFADCNKLTTIRGIKNLKTDNVTDMKSMFKSCLNLRSLDVSGFNTENVTDMARMFSSCVSLTDLDVSNFNTENVTDMMYAFSGCGNLTSLDVSNFNTEKVTNMSNMFSNCSSLKSLDVSNFNTEKVTNMTEAFFGCKSLTSLDVSNFNTANVTRMDYMFYGCSSLTSLDLSSFNTKNVRNWECMFRNCSSLTTIYVSGRWSTANGNGGNNMFYGCTSLVGGQGTTFDANNTNKTYARIDEPDNDAPGYLTSANKELEPVNEVDEIDFSGDGSTVNENTNLDGNVIGNIFYSIAPTDGGYNKSEGYIEVTRPTSDDDMDAIAGKDLSDDAMNDFTGIIFKVNTGKGTIKVNGETTGGMTLKVKIGNAQSMAKTLDVRQKATFQYNVSEPTYVYIYAGNSGAASARGNGEEPSLKIYGIEWKQDSGTPTGVGDAPLLNDKGENHSYYDLQGRRIDAQPKKKGVYVRQGRKVVVRW
ncbi:MAG: BspA family leucine-rich repeat surface protein [Prevotella sp.]|nr:BspA family leucine-rich repeat surface protein [Prevotella sp.]